MTRPERLIAAYLDDALTPAEQAELTAWLKADPAHLRQFVEANVREQHLRTVVQGRGSLVVSGAALPDTPGALTTVGAPAFRRRPIWWAAAAAVLVLLSVALGWRTLVSGAVAAEVLAAADARLIGHSEPLRVGEQLRLRVVRLEAGSVRLRLPNGVVLDIAGPADARFEDAMHLRVSRGKFTADVGPRGKGFTIDTAQARIVDLGTRFGIDASSPDTTDVVVFEGHVEVYEPAARTKREAGPLVRIDAGEAVRFEQSQAPSRIVFIVQGWEDADWASGSEPPKGAVIQHVTDNLGLADSRRFYRVRTGGMVPGAPARHVQRPRWFPHRQENLPDWLLGADLIETFGIDKFEQHFELTVTLAEPALLCVFQDSGVPPPEWLRAGFVPSGFQLVIKRVPADEPGPGVTPATEVPFDVWTREVHTPGPVTLGPPRSAESIDRGRMYGVAARALGVPGVRSSFQ